MESATAVPVLPFDPEACAEAQIHWIIRDSEPGSRGIWSFRYSGPRDTVAERLKQAIHDYTASPDGQMDQALAGCGSFNWGDAMNGVPEEWWHRYGLAFQGADPTLLSIEVEHDDNFGLDADDHEAAGRTECWEIGCSGCGVMCEVWFAPGEAAIWSQPCRLWRPQGPCQGTRRVTREMTDAYTG